MQINVSVFLFTFVFDLVPSLTLVLSILRKLPSRERHKRRMPPSPGGVNAGFKLIFKNNQLLWLAIATFLINAANNMVSAYNTSIMSQNNFSMFEITIALATSRATGIVIGYVMGPIADKFSRKSASVIFVVLSAVSFIGFAFGTPYFGNGTVSAIIAGTLFGISMNSYNNILTI